MNSRLCYDAKHTRSVKSFMRWSKTNRIEAGVGERNTVREKKREGEGERENERERGRGREREGEGESE